MSPNDQEIFWQLGRDRRSGAPLPAPFTDASAIDVAVALCTAMEAEGLSLQAIRKVALALLGVTIAAKGGCDARPARKVQGGRP